MTYTEQVTPAVTQTLRIWREVEIFSTNKQKQLHDKFLLTLLFHSKESHFTPQKTKRCCILCLLYSPVHNSHCMTPFPDSGPQAAAEAKPSQPSQT